MILKTNEIGDPVEFGGSGPNGVLRNYVRFMVFFYLTTWEIFVNSPKLGILTWEIPRCIDFSTRTKTWAQQFGIKNWSWKCLQNSILRDWTTDLRRKLPNA